MSKYDFGYILEKGTTNFWAYEQIKNNSKVLEIGPAIGNLTYHLSENKKCTVDIVEIDEEAGSRASVFARKALLGTLNGNLNNSIWYSQLELEKYDYIIALDVLEHLQDPEQVLVLLKSLLNDKGQIVLSIPNIAHNAVIAAMIENKFNYTELGLLDRTHIHFFAYHSIIAMIEQAELNVYSIDAIKKVAMDTEIENSFENLPREVRYYLQTRDYADAYQYLIVLQQEMCDTKNYLQDGHHQDSLYETKVLVNGLSKHTICEKSCLGTIKLSIDLTQYDNVTSLRFIPVENACLVTNLEATVIKQDGTRSRLFFNVSAKY